MLGCSARLVCEVRSRFSTQPHYTTALVFHTVAETGLDRPECLDGLI